MTDELSRKCRADQDTRAGPPQADPGADTNALTPDLQTSKHR